MHGLAGNNAGSLELDGTIALSIDGALAVDRHAERVDNAAEQALACRNFHDTTSGANLVVFLDCGDVTEKNSANLILFEVLGQTIHGLAALTHELEELACHSVTQTVDASNTVADLDNRTDLARLDADIQSIKLLAQSIVNRLSGDFSH